MNNAEGTQTRPKQVARRKDGGGASSRVIRLTEQRKQALDLRRQGKSFRQIGEAMGISHTRAHELVTEAIEEFGVRERCEEIVQIELERLDRMFHGIYPAAVGGDTGAIKLVLKIQERRAKYLGLDKPQKVETTADQGPATREIATDIVAAMQRMSEVASKLNLPAPNLPAL